MQAYASVRRGIGVYVWRGHVSLAESLLFESRILECVKETVCDRTQVLFGFARIDRIDRIGSSVYVGTIESCDNDDIVYT